MNAKRMLSTLAAALLIAASASLTLAPVQGATTKMAVSPEVVSACAGIEHTAPNAKSVPACATALQKGLEANSADLKALLMSAKSDDKAAPKLLLMKYGLTKAQLTDAVIVVKDETGGGSATRIKSITITCCPLTITIKF